MTRFLKRLLLVILVLGYYPIGSLVSLVATWVVFPFIVFGHYLVTGKIISPTDAPDFREITLERPIEWLINLLGDEYDK